MHIRRRVLVLCVVVVLIAAACGGDDDDVSSGSDSAPAAAEPAPAASAGDLAIVSVDFDSGTAVIENTGDSDFDLAGHWLCNRPSYAELDAQVLAAGETLEVGLGGFSAAGGELGIYSSNDFGSSDDMIAYVEWGSGGGRSSVAASAGLWSGDPVQPGGDGIELQGTGGSAAGWE